MQIILRKYLVNSQIFSKFAGNFNLSHVEYHEKSSISYFHSYALFFIGKRSNLYI
jgi:hypothetical protein